MWLPPFGILFNNHILPNSALDNILGTGKYFGMCNHRSIIYWPQTDNVIGKISEVYQRNPSFPVICLLTYLPMYLKNSNIKFIWDITSKLYKIFISLVHVNGTTEIYISRLLKLIFIFFCNIVLKLYKITISLVHNNGTATGLNYSCFPYEVMLFHITRLE